MNTSNEGKHLQNQKGISIMAINIQETCGPHIKIVYFTEEGYVFQCLNFNNKTATDEKIKEVIIKYNFCFADVYDTKTNNLLLHIERDSTSELPKIEEENSTTKREEREENPITEIEQEQEEENT